MEQINRKAQRIIDQVGGSLGEHGGVRISNTAKHEAPEGYYIAVIQAEEDTVIDAVIGNIDLDGAKITAEGIRAGKWSELTLTSGVCIAYHMKEL